MYFKSSGLLLPNNLDTSASLSVGMCRTTIGAKSSTVTAAKALSPDATVLSTHKNKQEKENTHQAYLNIVRVSVSLAH